MFIHFGKPRQITELHTPGRVIAKMKREDVKMVVLDDEKFPYLDILKLHKFNIDTLNDINSLTTLEAYDVVLCDLNGVGKAFSEQYQGAYLVKEIYNRYPFKIIVSYTGISFDARYNEYLKYADFSLKKDIESEKWVEKLDMSIEMLSNLEKRWTKMRDFLLNNNVSLYNAMLLEDNLVKYIETGSKDEFPATKLLNGIRGDIKDVLISFAGSAAVRLLMP